jgi:beta-lysine 5,6-aminomutase beta subunit
MGPDKVRDDSKYRDRAAGRDKDRVKDRDEDRAEDKGAQGAERFILPYGDHRGDGVVQISFTLPLPHGPLGDEAARQVMRQMALTDPQVAVSVSLGENYTFYVGYGKLSRPVDTAKLKVARPLWDKIEPVQVEQMVRERLGRPIIVVGAATGSDAHTVGLDAILNYKGFAGDHGLEAYSCFKVVNMGSQVPNEELVARAKQEKADAILVSQVVTQGNVHLANLTNLSELLEAEGWRDRVVLVAGGPRITHALALELGFDAGFGAMTRPQDVASYLAQEVLRRKSLY